jgi:hypothetical protein
MACCCSNFISEETAAEEGGVVKKNFEGWRVDAGGKNICSRDVSHHCSDEKVGLMGGSDDLSGCGLGSARAKIEAARPNAVAFKSHQTRN